jgi:adenylate kinase
MKTIIITGTPGCGKSTLTKKISKIMDSEYISINQLVHSEEFIEEYDEKRNTYIADFDKLIPYLIDVIEKAQNENCDFFFIEGHFADIVPNKFIDIAIILRCHPDILKKRLEKRGYKESKVIENLQAEILGNSTNYILEKDLDCPVYEIDISEKSIDETLDIIENIIIKDEIKNCEIGKIDWLCNLSKNNRLNEFFD